MIELDSAAGGGQLLRTALSLSAITGAPFRIEKIRGRRPQPGLRPQHLAAVTVVAEYCDADVEGAQVGSASVTFRPGESRVRDLAVDIGTAGSVTLLFDTILPIAIADSAPVSVRAHGGTDVKWAPTVGYHRHVKLPLLRRFGVDADIELEATGFYPTGGGAARLSVRPAPLTPIALDARGPLDRVDIHSKASTDLESAGVADRQADQAATLLQAADLPVGRRTAELCASTSTGSALVLAGVYERSRIGVDVLGERGRPSEAVAAAAVRRFQTLHNGGAPVDEYMADQVMLPLAIAGGRVRLPTLTDHVATNRRVMAAFGAELGVAEGADGPQLEAEGMVDPPDL